MMLSFLPLLLRELRKTGEHEAEGFAQVGSSVWSKTSDHGEERIQSKCQGEGWWMFGMSEWSTWFLLAEMILQLKE